MSAWADEGGNGPVPRYCTYGVLPDWEEFSSRYSDVCGDGEFSGTNDPYLGNYSFTESELHDQLEAAVSEWEDGDDMAGDWASAVMTVLGIEWV